MRQYMLIFFISFAAIVHGVGISVSPGTFVIQEVSVGEMFDISGQVGYFIKIGAQSNPGYYTITPRRPSDDGTTATGYYDFPQPDWFHTEYGTLYVDPKHDAQTAMWLTLPDDPALYNRHFLLGVDVSPIIEDARGMISVGAYLLFRFETEPKAGVVPDLQDGEMVFAPSVVQFDSLSKGDNKSVDLKFFVWSEQKQPIKFYRLDPESDVARITIVPTPGYRRAPEGIIYFPETMRADNNGANFFVQVALSEEMNYPRLEDFIIAEAPNGNKAFLRVKMTKKNRY